MPEIIMVQNDPFASDKRLSQFDKIYRLIEDSPKYGAKTHWGEILPTERRFSKLDITFSNQRWGLNALSSETSVDKEKSLSHSLSLAITWRVINFCEYPASPQVPLLVAKHRGQTQTDYSQLFLNPKLNWIFSFIR